MQEKEYFLNSKEFDDIFNRKKHFTTVIQSINKSI
jgi:hypothetical protein